MKVCVDVVLWCCGEEKVVVGRRKYVVDIRDAVALRTQTKKERPL